jgi:hypothetical protein
MQRLLTAAQHADVSGLRQALRWLDGRLATALDTDRAEPPDPLRGLYVTACQARDLLAGERGARPAPDDPLAAEGSLALLAGRFGLSRPDLELLVVVLAPELDLRYEQIYGYLQDDVTRHRATVELVLRLVFDDASYQSPGHVHLWPTAPLVRHGLVEIAREPGESGLAAGLAVDDQVVRVLLGYTGLDPRLAGTGRLLGPETWPDMGAGAPARRIAALGQDAQRRRVGLRVYLHEGRRGDAADVAMAVAALLGAPLLEVRAYGWPGEAAELFRVLARECIWHGAVLHLRDLGRDDQSGAWLAALGEPGVVCLISGEGPAGDLPEGTVLVPVAGAGYRDRRARWAAMLAQAGAELPGPDVDALAARFRIPATQIAGVIAAATVLCAPPATDDLFAAARAQSGQELEGQAQRIEPRYGWDDIVLLADQRDQLAEICDRVRLRHVVHEEWGFGHSPGLTVLFSGGPGTGKTMAAEVIARDLGLDLFRIDLAQVVSKYIGDTEKRLESIFRHAERADAILFFDEAEALFGRRSEVRDAHDRYANIEVAYLLQRMEAHDGITILATNLRRNIDPAFMRRLQFAVDFPHPDREMRLEIWRRVWPNPGRLDPDADLEFMASQFDIPGGHISNIAVKAAFLAARDGTLVTLRHLILAARRELQQLGKVVVDDDLGIHAGLVRT